MFEITKFYTPSLNNSLVISVKQKHKENIRTAAMLLFYIPQRKYLNKSCMLSEDVILYIISGPYIKWLWYRSHLTSSRVCYVVITDFKKVKATARSCGDAHIITFIPNFANMSHLLQKFKRGLTQRGDPISPSFRKENRLKMAYTNIIPIISGSGRLLDGKQAACI
jgi:hypothetical protein